jgi:hypothetical protein
MNMDLDFAIVRQLNLTEEGFTYGGYMMMATNVLSDDGDWLYTSLIRTDEGRYYLIHFSWNTETDDYDFFEDIDFGVPLAADFAPREVFPFEQYGLS